MKGEDIVSRLRKAFLTSTNRELAARLGLSTVALHNWAKRSRVTPRQVSGLVRRASVAAASNAEVGAIRPIVEFFPIFKTKSTRSDRYELFSATVDGRAHPYRKGLRTELENNHGIYIFFDSRGQAIYAGKARKQTIWHEMKLAFNRKRGDLQTIRRVRQPTRKQPYSTSDDKARQIRDFIVPLHDLAAYFSAYQVADGMVNELEAMLVRSFPNDLLNKRMERFGHQRRIQHQRAQKKRPKH